MILEMFLLSISSKTCIYIEIMEIIVTSKSVLFVIAFLRLTEKIVTRKITFTTIADVILTNEPSSEENEA